MPSQLQSALVVGSGPILLSLAEAWYDAGLSELAICITNTQLTETEKLKNILDRTLPINPDASLQILAIAGNKEIDWESVIRPFPFILYVSQHGDLEELRKLQAACIAEQKLLLPAMVVRGRGIAGPLLQPDDVITWEDAWRRIHSTVFPPAWEHQTNSPQTADVLANLVLYEWTKLVLEEEEADCKNQCYILNPLTLEGTWHPILTHPCLSGNKPTCTVIDIEHELQIGQEHVDIEVWFDYFNQLTSEVTGIFHIWGEGSLGQLPLAQCLVQPADPLSEGPAELLPAIVISGLTHPEARREAGLAGLESYIARSKRLLASAQPILQREEIHIGAGCTLAEAVGRGLGAYLAEQLRNRSVHGGLVLQRAELVRIEDVHCRFYLQALTMLEGEPLVGIGEPLLGFPVVWVRSGADWYSSTHLSTTLAFRQALQHALMKTGAAPVSSVIWNDPKPARILIPAGHPMLQSSEVLSAVQILKQHHRRLEAIDMRCEPFLKDGPLSIIGVQLREEASP